MAVDIGPRIGIDGEKEFRQQLSNINQQLRTLGSEMKAVTSAFDSTADSEEALVAQSKVLNQQIDAQKTKLTQLQKGLEASAEKYGENDTRTLKWAQAVQDATSTLNRMQSKLQNVQSQMAGSGNTYDNLTFPAGSYRALQVKIGEAAGQNWWCVLYPLLCFTDEGTVSVPEDSQERLQEALGEEDYERLENAGRPQLRFKLLEWLEKLF